MDHTEARAQLLERALEPARLRGVDQDTSPGSSELRAHLATCAPCRADLEGWRATYGALDAAVGEASADGDLITRSLRELAASAGVATPPAALRERTLAAVHERTPTRVSPTSAPRRSIRPPAWLAIAAALFVLLGGSALIVGRTAQLDQSRADTAALAAVTASIDRILQDPGHQVAVLTTPAGTPAGSVSWSPSEGRVAVVTSALRSPPSGQVYRCWIEQAGARTAVGEMRFSGSLAYWAGSLGSWGGTFAPGGRFWVSLEPASGGAGSGPPALVGTL